jgi:hypothetical protein
MHKEFYITVNAWHYTIGAVLSELDDTDQNDLSNNKLLF